MSGAATTVATSKLSAFWNHPAGPKTVFFWGPAMKWSLVLAGLKDLSRPVEKLSVSQNLGKCYAHDAVQTQTDTILSHALFAVPLSTTALTATGFIWVRYALVITPINYSLAAVNFCVGLSGLSQLGRIVNYRYTARPAADKPHAV
ncbi:hypothetical protein PLICRDRAFT_172583 [Plicaturopsis crispa FD-325 SS-3]|nr:hypothetical protein PLICRDRAFT_172583 [Plicaturopsis crispa FD-325 SS-3]